jgi:co-chaperonin GroES (HSP10)
MKDKNNQNKVILDPSEWAIINESEAFRAIGNRILVLEDEFRSGLECKTCDGKGHIGIPCEYCKGTRMFKGRQDGGACPDCEIGTSDARKSLGYQLCPDCKGRQGLIIVPDNSKRRPVTGKVVSVGHAVTEFKVGDRVMYTNFTGTDFDIKGGFKVRVMLEHDVMAEYKQLKKSSGGVNEGAAKQDLTDLGVTVNG